MQPDFYPDDDPGPEALLTDLQSQENMRRLHKILARGAGAFALTTSSGGGLLRSPQAMTPVLQDLARRGLGWVDLPLFDKTVSHNLAQQFGTVYLAGGLLLDSTLTSTALDNAVQQALAAAQQHGRILLVARPYPLSLQTLTRLIDQLPAAGIALVPVSALLQPHTTP